MVSNEYDTIMRGAYVIPQKAQRFGFETKTLDSSPRINDQNLAYLLSAKLTATKGIRTTIKRGILMPEIKRIETTCFAMRDFSHLSRIGEIML